MYIYRRKGENIRDICVCKAGVRCALWKRMKQFGLYSPERNERYVSIYIVDIHKISIIIWQNGLHFFNFFFLKENCNGPWAKRKRRKKKEGDDDDVRNWITR